MNWLIRFLTPSWVWAITLYPFGIFYRGDYLSQKTQRHELIHWKQQKEMLAIFFYLWYIIEWFIRIFVNRGYAYKNISFEREAYGNDRLSSYLKNRKRYAWIKYMRNAKK